MKNKIVKILELVIIIEITIVLILMELRITKINDECNSLKKKTNQIELDYKFLKYNTEQLEELRWTKFI